MQFHISEASNVRISGFTAAWIHLSIWMFWWSRSICRVMQGGGLRCCLLSPTTATWSMVCPKYRKHFKLVQGGKTFMKKAWVFGADKHLQILCKESWVLTGSHWIGLVQLRLRCQDVTDWARVQVFFLTETPNFATTCWRLNLLQAPNLKLENYQVWQLLGFGLLIDHHILHLPAYW